MTAKVLTELKPFAPGTFFFQDEGIEMQDKSPVKSTPGIVSHSTTAAPIVATTITLEALQDFLHKQGFPVEASPCNDDVYLGPFDDTQFDMVVDVQTQQLDEKPMILENMDVMSSCSDLSEDDLSVLPGMSLLSSVPDFSDEDLEEFYSDSGVESDECSEDQSTHSDSVKSSKIQNNVEKSETQTTEKTITIKTEPQSPKPYLEVEQDVTVSTEYDSDINPDKEDISCFKSCQFLWEFLQALLSDKRFTQFIEWKHEKQGIFRMKDHHGLARLWGKHKRKKNMTYDKLSRALRHYYHKNIMKKVDGQRLTYRYCKGYMPTRWK